MAHKKVSEKPKVSENIMMDSRPVMMTGFLPTLSLTYPIAYPLKKRPNMNAPAT